MGRLISRNAIANTNHQILQLQNLWRMIQAELTVGGLLTLFGKLSFLTQIHVGLRNKCSTLQRIISKHQRVNKSKHKDLINLTPEQFSDIEKMISIIKLNTPWTFCPYLKTYSIYTDASMYGFGYASLPKAANDNIYRTIYPHRSWYKNGTIDLEAHPMFELELLAIYNAVFCAPLKCNLILYTDSQTCMDAWKSGIFKISSQFPEAIEIFDKIYALTKSKQINLLLRRVSTENNPADLPSRTQFNMLTYGDPCYNE